MCGRGENASGSEKLFFVGDASGVAADEHFMYTAATDIVLRAINVIPMERSGKQ